MSYNKVGRTFEASGMHDEPVAYFQRNFEIAERLAASDPSNANGQKDLEISRARIARLKR